MLANFRQETNGIARMTSQTQRVDLAENHEMRDKKTVLRLGWQDRLPPVLGATCTARLLNQHGRAIEHQFSSSATRQGDSVCNLCDLFL